MEQFGKYLLGQRIAVGGMAEIFHAKVVGPEGFEKDLAIKRILPAWSVDPEFIRMFVNEATLASKLCHANIVQIFDFNEVGGIFYIAMELVEGRDLQCIVREIKQQDKRLPVRLATYVASEALKALHYAHGRSAGGQGVGIIHRDISPQNILLSFNGEVKLTDFGIAKALSAVHATKPGVVKGKLAYMAPEQLLRGGVDPRTDLYALGIVFWEMLTGRSLFQGENDADTVGAVLRSEVPSPRRLNPEVNSDVEDACMRLLRREPTERFATAAEALHALSMLDGAAGQTLQLELAELLKRLFPIAGAAEPTAAPQTHTRMLEEGGTIPIDSALIDVGVGRGSRPEARSAAQTWRLRTPRRAWVLGLLAGAIAVALGLGLRMKKPIADAPGKATSEIPVGSLSAREPAGESAGVARNELFDAQAPSEGRSLRPDEALPASSSPSEGIHVGKDSSVEKAHGSFTVLVRPWAEVYLDGRYISQTPLRRHTVSTGRHVLLLRNSELGQKESTAVRIRAGKDTLITRRWDSQP